MSEPVSRTTAGCIWAEDENGSYDTSCGDSFTLNDGSPSQNSMKFCCYCGAPLLEEPYTEEREDAE